MTYGDEWVRAIFRKKHTVELSNNESSFNKYSSNDNESFNKCGEGLP